MLPLVKVCIGLESTRIALAVDELGVVGLSLVSWAAEMCRIVGSASWWSIVVGANLIGGQVR